MDDRATEGFLFRADRPPEPSRRIVVSSLAGLAVARLLGWSSEAQAVGSTTRAMGETMTPEHFGAIGNGVADDTPAFQALSEFASARKSGVIALRAGAVYRVGRQTFSGVADGASYRVQPILALTGVEDMTVLGNGATMKLNDGLHYGAFDPVSGKRYDYTGDGHLYDKNYAATVGSLLLVQSSRRVHIENLILDGNMDKIVVGGSWDVDIQLHADGLTLLDVSEITVDHLLSRNNGLDGVYLRAQGRATSDAPPANIRFRNVRCDRNGRQGISIVGGISLSFEQCAFTNTAQGPIGSRPKAGVDIEPNGNDWASDLLFDGCTFDNNVGVGLLANSGSSHAITARNCTFWQGFAQQPGVTSGSGDAFWLLKTGVVVDRCQVHGCVSNLAADAMVTNSSFDDALRGRYGRAGQRPYLLNGVRGNFIDCTFTVEGDTGRGLVTTNKEASFKRCQLRYAGNGMGPNTPVAWLGPPVILEDVVFSEAARNVPPGGFFIYSRAQLRGSVSVQGKNVRWGKGGRTGQITAG